MHQMIVSQSYVGLFYEDGVFKRVLTPGKYWVGRFLLKTRSIKLVDMREQSLTIKGQEILTEDKVAIRISILVYYKITDSQSAIHNVPSYEERIYEDVQLATRRFLSTRNLDAILRDRNEISNAVTDDVKNTATGYGVAIVRADVKDLVFPGNLREIMNLVLETERQAEAKILQAKKDAEAGRIRSEAEKEQVELRLETELMEAQAVQQNPALLKLRKLKTLSEMARQGGKFVVGLKSTELKDVFQDSE
ncbi:MAG: slipin family protein [Patescibacteria group bacterium]